MKVGRFEIYWPNAMLFVLCAIWALLMFITPLSQPADTIDLGGEGIVYPVPDNLEKYDHIDNYLIKRIYESGDRNCHQRNYRSIFLNGNEMPYCTRDVAIFVGMAVGAFISMLWFVRLDWKWVVAGLVPMGIDGTIQLLTAYESNNILRLVTGFPAGLITTLALGAVLYEVSRMFQRMAVEKTAELKLSGKNGPVISYRLRHILIAGSITAVILLLIVLDFWLHK